MFCGLLKSNFNSKCKAALKLTKTRIEVIKNKKNAIQKFLRNDIADLLKAGHAINAFGRAEWLLIELNGLSCYELIEQFCGCLANNLPLMSKQRECPEYCKEAISSLIFAAARFGDLPELRKLRRLFTDRYGDSLEVYINHELIKKLKPMTPTKEMKLQLMQDIALEAGTEWNSKALEQHLNNLSAIEQDHSKDSSDDKYKLHERRNQTENNVQERENQYHFYDLRLENSPIKDIHIDQNGQEKISNLVKSASEEEDYDKIAAFDYKLIVPPYAKPNIRKYRTSLDQVPCDSVEEEETRLTKLKGEDKSKPRSVRRRWRKQEDGNHGLKISSEDILDQLEKEDVTDTSIARAFSLPSESMARNY